jgi:hypothetical protein
VLAKTKRFEKQKKARIAPRFFRIAQSHIEITSNSIKGNRLGDTSHQPLELWKRRMTMHQLYYESKSTFAMLG